MPMLEHLDQRTFDNVTEAREPVYTGDDLSREGNYGPGYIGFSYTHSLISWGITHYTRWDRLSDIKVSHAMIVISETECVEALMHKGVVISPLSNYFGHSNRCVFFRKPKGLTPELAVGIVQAAKTHVHQHYENQLMLADIVNGSLLGHWINQWTNQGLARILARLLDDKRGWLCSELAAECLQTQDDWPYHCQGVLKNPADMISPQALFEDNLIFSAWH